MPWRPPGNTGDASGHPRSVPDPCCGRGLPAALASIWASWAYSSTGRSTDQSVTSLSGRQGTAGASPVGPERLGAPLLAFALPRVIGHFEIVAPPIAEPTVVVIATIPAD